MSKNLAVSEQRILLFSVFVISVCGIIYELVLGSLATYLLGNPVQQYSITIGVFLSAMGLGSFFSRFFTKDLMKNFIRIEITLGIVGGLSVIILQYLFSFSFAFYLLHVFFLLVIGVFVGLEIPILTRILKEYGSLKDIISNVLTFDYIGGLAGSLLFPMVLFPYVGRFMTSLLIGIINISIAIFVIVKINYRGKKKADFAYPVLSILILVILIFNSQQLNSIMQKRLFFDDVIITKRTKYQEIVLTGSTSDFRLYLDGALQFSTFDEYRYHEMLVFPSVFLNKSPQKDVLVLGGGDGLAVRDILKCSDIRSVVLVELDPEMINLAKRSSTFRKINENSLLNKKVKVVIGDAYKFLKENKGLFNVIIADFPDPHDKTIAKLYTVEFYHLIKRSLTRDGIFVTQSTSPLFAGEAYWCIHNTINKVFKNVIPYHVYIPTFGEWGFNIASRVRLDKSYIENIKVDDIKYRFFSKDTFINSMHFQEDSKKLKTNINSFNGPLLYIYYLKGWKNFDL